MKNLFLLIGLALALTACGGEEAPTVVSQPIKITDEVDEPVEPTLVTEENLSLAKKATELAVLLQGLEDTIPLPATGCFAIGKLQYDLKILKASLELRVKGEEAQAAFESLKESDMSFDYYCPVTDIGREIKWRETQIQSAMAFLEQVKAGAMLGYFGSKLNTAPVNNGKLAPRLYVLTLRWYKTAKNLKSNMIIQDEARTGDFNFDLAQSLAELRDELQGRESEFAKLGLSASTILYDLNKFEATAEKGQAGIQQTLADLGKLVGELNELTLAVQKANP